MENGSFKNGDFWKGEQETEEGRDWFFAYKSLASDSADYSTQETPDPALILFPDHTAASFNQEYELAKRIGARRFGTECKHESVFSGHCKNCLRKVVG